MDGKKPDDDSTDEEDNVFSDDTKPEATDLLDDDIFDQGAAQGWGI
jgi:hypothetical protein